MAFGDLERPNGSYYALFHAKRQLLKPTASNSLQLDPHCQRQTCNLGSLILAICGIWGGCALSLRLHTHRDSIFTSLYE